MSDERERFSLYRLCECPNCAGTGREQLSSPVRVKRDGTMRTREETDVDLTQEQAAALDEYERCILALRKLES